MCEQFLEKGEKKSFSTLFQKIKRFSNKVKIAILCSIRVDIEVIKFYFFDCCRCEFVRNKFSDKNFFVPVEKPILFDCEDFTDTHTYTYTTT